MRIALFNAACVALCWSTAAAAFVPNVVSTKPTTASLQASRRDVMTGAVSSLLLPVLLIPTTANAELDFDRVQDLLKDTPSNNAADVFATTRTKRPTYLAEPTEEFRQNEQKSTAFKREQLKVKGQFTALLQKLQDDPNEEDKLSNDLDELRRLVRKVGGLPLGITKEEVVKQVRRRKARKFWPVNVEIA